MKTQSVKIKSFKALNGIEADLKGHHVLLTGENGVGKSSFIQFIEIALGKNTNIPPGATGEGEVVMSKDGRSYRFQVKFKDGKPLVTITSPDGMKDTRRGTLAAIVGAIDFDIDEFAELSKSSAGRKKQVEIFKSFLPAEDIQVLDGLNLKIKSIYDDRTDLNRIITEKRAWVNNHRLLPVLGIQKFEHKEIKAVLDRVSKLKEDNRKRDEVVKRHGEREKSMKETARKIAELQAVLDADQLLQVKAEEWIAANPAHEPDVIAAAEKDLENVEQDNKDFTDYQELQREQELLTKMIGESEDMTALIESSRQTIADTIRQMESPVQGLEFDEEQLYYNGIPVNPDSLSTSELMRLGIRIKVAQNKEAPLFIQRAESLGKKAWKEIITLADELGLQVIAEQVQRGQDELRVELVSEQTPVTA